MGLFKFCDWKIPPLNIEIRQSSKQPGAASLCPWTGRHSLGGLHAAATGWLCPWRGLPQTLLFLAL